MALWPRGIHGRGPKFAAPGRFGIKFWSHLDCALPPATWSTWFPVFLGQSTGGGEKKTRVPSCSVWKQVFFLAFEWLLWLCKSKYAYAIKRLPSESPAWKCMAIFVQMQHTLLTKVLKVTLFQTLPFPLSWWSTRGIWYESTAEQVIQYMVYGKELICINTYWCG